MEDITDDILREMAEKYMMEESYDKPQPDLYGLNKILIIMLHLIIMIQVKCQFQMILNTIEYLWQCGKSIMKNYIMLKFKTDGRIRKSKRNQRKNRSFS